MLHDLLDNNVYEVDLYYLKDWNKNNLDEMLENENYHQKIMVQKTIYKNLYREIITGELINAYVKIGKSRGEDWLPSKYERIYPKTNTFIYIDIIKYGSSLKTNYKVANLDEIREYLNTHQDKQQFFQELTNLKEEENGQKQEKQILRTLKRNYPNKK